MKMEQTFDVGSIQTLFEMEEFDYTGYDVETLQNVIDRRMQDVKDANKDIRRLEKKLTSRRGYSRKQLNAMTFHLRGAERLVRFLNIEIMECASESGRKNKEEIA